MVSKKVVGVFIPAYNEEKTIYRVIKEAVNEIKALGFVPKVIVVDDGSSDKTAQEARRAGAMVVSHPRNFGLAETYRTGMREILKINPDYILQTDADAQYLAEDIPKLLQPLIDGKADLVLGSRFKGTIEEMPWLKRLGNKMFSKVISNISGYNISDGQTGFRAFLPEIAEKIEVRSDHTYTQEVILRAAEQKYRIIEVPIYFAKRADGKSRLISNPFDYAKRATLNLLRVYRDHQPLKFFGWIGLLLILPSLLFGIWLVYLHLTEGVSGHVPMQILTMILFLSGLQIILFGFMADKK